MAWGFFVSDGDCAGARAVFAGRNLVGAAVGGRENFAGVAEAGGVEDGANTLHRLQGFGREQQRHVVALLDADAMFAGQGAADAEAEF